MPPVVFQLMYGQFTWRVPQPQFCDNRISVKRFILLSSNQKSVKTIEPTLERISNYMHESNHLQTDNLGTKAHVQQDVAYATEGWEQGWRLV